ncbi:unnamed protein product [Ectocarpus sp. 12 AP-2014]
MLGRRSFQALYDAALICFDLCEEDVRAESSRECGLCSEAIGVGAEFGTCGHGHVACKHCVSKYVEKTLMPVRTVWVDTVPCCVDSDCSAFFTGQDVSACLSGETIKQLETIQMDVSHLLAGDIDPSSKKLLDKDTKACPACGIPIFKTEGCDHICCRMCGHDFWWSCSDTCKNYPWHSNGCSAAYALAEVSLV